MYKKAGSIKIRKTTVVLLVIFILLVSSSVFILLNLTSLNYFYITHREYKIYGGLTEELKGSGLYEDMESGKSFCFLGDSITCGSATYGIPWYQPFIPYIKGDIFNLSKAGWLVQDLIDSANEIPETDIYVIAIGINDVLFADETKAAASAGVFADRCRQLSDIITSISPNAKIYFIAPWPFYDFEKKYTDRADQFRAELAHWCNSTDYIYYINPEPYITSVINEKGMEKYMQNTFHPNAPNGIGLFCYAVLKADYEQ